jgi:hypothetical protein
MLLGEGGVDSSGMTSSSLIAETHDSEAALLVRDTLQLYKATQERLPAQVRAALEDTLVRLFDTSELRASDATMSGPTTMNVVMSVCSAKWQPPKKNKQKKKPATIEELVIAPSFTTEMDIVANLNEINLQTESSVWL